MRQCRLAAALVLASTTPLLQGCAAGAAMAAQAVPLAIGTVAMSRAPDESPFRSYADLRQPGTEEELAMLDEQIRRAECGVGDSQFWLASTLGNRFNATPDEVEIYKWYRLSELDGFPPAAARARALEETMAAGDLAEAEARVAAWRPATEGCAGLR